MSELAKLSKTETEILSRVCPTCGGKRDPRGTQCRKCSSTQRATARATHRMTGSVEYLTWSRMKSRCYDPESQSFGNYGGRGIVVCSEWLHDFMAFYRYVGPRPGRGYSLDRYPNNDGNYEPGNVRWATAKQQLRNTRANTVITFRGKTQCLEAWAEELGMLSITLGARIGRYGMSMEDAASTPVRRRSRKRTA